MKKFIELFKKRLLKSLHFISCCIISDKSHAEKRFKKVFKKQLNLRKPKTFNEKIQWLKLYDRKNEYCKFADKYSVRKIIKKRIGDHILNEIYGTYDNIKDIQIEKLPKSFVLKATHGSGWNILCENKQKLNWNKAKNNLNAWLIFNYYELGREWVYKNIKPRIVCEKFLKPKSGENLLDYKFFCFNGKPKIIQVDIDRFGNHIRNFYDTNWQLQPFSLLYPNSNKIIKKPKKLKKMLEYAKKLSTEFKFARIDFYSFDNKIIFGEITFYPENGFAKFHPSIYDKKLGNLLQL